MARQVQSLDGLDIDIKVEGAMLETLVTLFLGDIGMAHQQALHILAETQQRELMGLAAHAQRLLANVLSVQEQYEQAEQYFTLALQAFRQYGMNLEYARTLYCQGLVQLQRGNAQTAYYHKGLRYLCEAREVFNECYAQTDCQLVERVLAAL